MQALRDNDIDVIGKKMTIAGAGGAATAIEIQAALDGVKEISIFNIHDKFWANAEETVRKINEKTNCKATLYDLDDKENYEMIYNNKSLNDLYENEIRPMFGELYEELLRQAESGDKSSVFYRHHMAYMEKNNFYVKSHVRKPYAEQEKNQLVVDYLASMTDDYFIALYHYLFPKGKHDVKFVGYFDL